jgi:hypothetical protein
MFMSCSGVTEHTAVKAVNLNKGNTASVALMVM